MAVDHLMSFSTFAEQRYFTFPTPATYRSVVLNGNMVAHAPEGIGAFLLEKTGKISYLIDPQTHAFQHQVSFLLSSPGVLKSSVKKLSQHLGSLVAEHAGKRPLHPADFANNRIRREFSECVVDFQCSLSSLMANSTANKYLDGTEEEYKPSLIVSPYFYLSENDYREWIVVMTACLEEAASHAGRKLWVEMCVSKGIFDIPDAQEQLKNLIGRGECEGVLLWIDDFDENIASQSLLLSVKNFLYSLKESSQKPVINLRGGYFSLLIASPAMGELLQGVSHGPEFGESRAVVPVGGGIPISKYYVPELHMRMRYRDALATFGAAGWLSNFEVFHKNVCDCPACVEIIGANSANFVLFGESNPKEVKRRNGMVRMEFPTSEAKERCLKHYLYRKVREYETVRLADASALKNDLDVSVAKYRDIVGDAGVRHLVNWTKVLFE